MQVLEGLSHLIYDEPDMNIFENALRNDVMKVSLHVFEKHVYVFIIVSSNRLV